MNFSIGTMKKTILYHPMGLFPDNQGIKSILKNMF